LLIGSALLFFAGGLTSVLLPIRGGFENFSSLSLGLLGTGWAIGYIAGCLLVPKIVMRVGHIRAFSVMAALACLSILLSSLLIMPITWILLRAITGFAFSGAAMIVESWLTERSDAGNRGSVFGFYTMVNLASTTAGQIIIAVGTPESTQLFVFAALFYVAALLPTALTTSQAPAPLAEARLDIGRLWRNSPVSVVAVALTGISNGSFGTLAAVYGDAIGLEILGIALFVSASLLAGAIAQLPIGYASDRFDRRSVVIALAVVALTTDIVFSVFIPQSLVAAIGYAAIFGAAIYTFYPVLVAHANDQADPSQGMQTSGGLLLLFGIGSVFGPLLGGVFMSYFGPEGLFVSTGIAHALLLAFTLWRITQSSAVLEDEKVTFVPIAPMRTRTPQTILLADLDNQFTE
jgi:MFS family permease